MYAKRETSRDALSIPSHLTLGKPADAGGFLSLLSVVAQLEAIAAHGKPARQRQGTGEVPALTTAACPDR